MTNISTISNERLSLEKARREFVKAATKDYDAKIHGPAMRALRERCAEEVSGHNRGAFHDNGLGWHWFYCSKCGARMEITGPE